MYNADQPNTNCNYNSDQDLYYIDITGDGLSELALQGVLDVGEVTSIVNGWSGSVAWDVKVVVWVPLDCSKFVLEAANWEPEPNILKSVIVSVKLLIV